MARLRYTLAEAEEEAVRLAVDAIKQIPNTANARLLGASPLASAPQSSSSKFPVSWNVVFVFHSPEVVMDGGEMMFDVNIETKEVKLWGA